MVTRQHDWLPHTIQGRIDMGRVWLDKLTVKSAAWQIPTNAIIERY